MGCGRDERLGSIDDDHGTHTNTDPNAATTGGGGSAGDDHTGHEVSVVDIRCCYPLLLSIVVVRALQPARS